MHPKTGRLPSIAPLQLASRMLRVIVAIPACRTAYKLFFKMSVVSRRTDRKPDLRTADLIQEVSPVGYTSEAAKVSAYAQIANGAALLAICIMAFSLRLFSVVKYESVIHEFDPYFNFRVTTYLTKEGFYNLWNWFDDRTWYPLGRVVGGTVYPVRAQHA